MYRQSKGKGTNQGFTLIEVLLALMIFATLSVAANQIFRNVINSNVQTEEVGNALKSLQRTLLIMDSDFRQMLARQYRNGSDEAKEALLEFGDDLLDSESQGIRFVRGGWINPQQLFPRGEVVKVGYRIQDETLERIRWMYPDNSSALEPAAMPLMEGVTGLRFEVLGDDGWKTEWEAPLSMPRAIRVTLNTERYGELTRIYLLPGQTLPPSVGETS
ncbi:type II secretion system protein GspJ [Grimontia hollisae]|uniref:Type II secretion system protein J n=1 Tax=Grimontia hollisae CIP 101886 TaxID=675812 RepID=D0I3A4_GRIHO|nr:type II secretion system minor pseudopilin GspJ [Grimontia hollisae]AMG30727.1 type II secretion system protein GspJ [Grimontia hollisae]EEY74049.1 general secretion pathway protein J [Grimontia hollisae CIP 101886]STO47540.1 PilD-dependent protein pddD [Grimontia hollisae]